MDLREVLVFLHVLGAAGWIGGGLFGIFATGRLAQSGGAGVGAALEDLGKRASLYFGTMFLLVVGAGVALVLTEDQWSWTDAFVLFGIGGVVLSGVFQGLVASKKDAAVVEAVKSDSPDRMVVIKAWRKTSWIDAAILIVVLWAMVVKLGA